MPVMGYNTPQETIIMIKDQINQDLLKLAEESDQILADIYRQIDQVCMHNSDRILSAFIENRVSYSDFSDINGYGNDSIQPHVRMISGVDNIS